MLRRISRAVVAGGTFFFFFSPLYSRSPIATKAMAKRQHAGLMTL